jgi:eukaryotic-like serine/threonine-protein kinase
MTPDPIQPIQTLQPTQPNRAVTPSSPARWHRASEIYVDSLEQAAGAPREAYFSLMCAGDDVLLQLVRSLIERESRTAPLLRPTYRAGAWAAALAADADQGDDGAASVGGAERWIGRRLGSYKITAEIARGGMGWVFKGLRDDAEFSKDVAIKLVRDSGDQARLIERFKAERQILATLDHPNIARLIDGGSTEEGFPFLVMEFVDGEPITDYARRNALGIGAKLELFRAVCAAVHFAHQRLVVHRDLKPSNIFVTHAGEVKLLDFGIAKMLQPTSPSSRADGTDPAATTLLAMTPAYASPEQIKGETITTASDVYALGVVLYELLTGQSPYKSASTQPMALAKEICETDPERPSTVVGRTLTPMPTAVMEGTEVSSAAAVNALEAAPPALNAMSIKRLQRGLRGDLDNIVLMALRKHPARRYASAEQLAEDVKRFGQNLPVSARADTFSYRATKFVQRNRWAVAVASLATVGMMGGLVGTIYQTSVARSALAQSERHFAEVRKLANDSLFDLHSAIENLPGATDARKKLIENASAYLDRLSSQASSDSSLQVDAAWGWFRLAEIQGGQSATNVGQVSMAEQNYKRSISLLALANQQRADDLSVASRLVKVRRAYGVYLSTLGRTADADAEYEGAIRLGTSKFDNTRATQGLRLDVAAALIFRATYAGDGSKTLEHARDPDTARQLMEDLLASPDIEPAMRNNAENTLAAAFQTLGEIANRDGGERDTSAAMQWATKSLNLHEDRLTRFPQNSQTQFNAGNANGLVARMFMMSARPGEALPRLRRALDLFKRVAVAAPDDNGAEISVLLHSAYLAAAQLDTAETASTRSTLTEFDSGWAHMSDENKKITESQTAGYVAAMVGARLEAARGPGHCDAARLIAERAQQLLNKYSQSESLMQRAIRVKTEADLRRCKAPEVARGNDPPNRSP